MYAYVRTRAREAREYKSCAGGEMKLSAASWLVFFFFFGEQARDLSSDIRRIQMSAGFVCIWIIKARGCIYARAVCIIVGVGGDIYDGMLGIAGVEES